MPKFQFVGHILPQAKNLSMKRSPSVTIKRTEKDFEIKMTFRISDGIATIDCSTTKPITSKFIREAFLFARRELHVLVDLIGFSNGINFLVDLNTYIDHDGKTQAISIENPKLAKLVTAYQKDGSDYFASAQPVLHDFSIGMAMRDLQSALENPDLAPINCARAIESIRSVIAGAGHYSQHWKALNSALNLTEEYVRFITDAAVARRHGEWNAPVRELQELYERCWIIMNRYLEYMKRNKSLPVSEFPIL